VDRVICAVRDDAASRRASPRQPRLEDKGTCRRASRRRAEDLDAFIEALETGGAFHNVLAVQEQTGQAGLIEAIVEATYVPAPRAAAVESAEPAAAPAPGGVQ
jgi:hypothetical protein